ncbi:cytochrome P450 [Micromonospora sp. RTGN7]|uniref:cytochrome P450 n=1 Tax=Micromonospora sp. RTGN7 TaxID=3016526 RepID=UPI0029FEDFA9|nr:cytochrome P450 [Micromonospora sp. RTGN7]
MSTQSAIPYPFPWTPVMEVPEALQGLRENALVEVRLPSGDTALLVTRYADVRSLFADDRLSKNIARPDVARITKDNDLFVDPKIDGDPPHHTRMRGLVTKAFTARRIELLRPYAQQVTDELLDAMATAEKPVELNEALAFPLPILVICKLLGIPPEDRTKFRRLVDGFLSVSKLPPAEVEECRTGLWDYLVELIDYKRANPGEDDLITSLIKVRDEDDNRLSEYELHHWTRSLLIAGYVTTASQIGTATAVLLHRQDLKKQIQQDWTLVPSAVEEMLRTQIMGSSIGTLRIALEDIPLADGTILPKGASVLLSEESANMDEEIFKDPFTLDIQRAENHHMTFGAGIHYCVGAALARMELQVATESLLRRFPDIRLAVPAGSLPRALGGFMEGFSAVPVTW